jgi:hypothetical protein
MPITVSFCMSPRPDTLDEHVGLTPNSGHWKATVIATDPLTIKQLEVLLATRPCRLVRFKGDCVGRRWGIPRYQVGRERRYTGDHRMGHDGRRLIITLQGRWDEANRLGQECEMRMRAAVERLNARFLP